MSARSRSRQLLVCVLVAVLTVSLVPGVAVAQSGIGGTTVVESGETVSSLSGVYGTIIVEGTVTGDVSGVAGNIVISDGGTVEGNLDVASGNVQIAGTVEGDVSAGAGTVHLTEGGVVGGTFDVGAADVRIDGTINGDASIGADTIYLGEGASLAGSLTYDGTLEGNLDAVAGEITRDRSLGVGLATDIQPFLWWVFTVNVFILNFLLGALLLGFFPRFSDGVANRVASKPLQSGAIGFGTVVILPVALLLIALTVIGIPITIGGLLLFALLVWIGLVYGRFAIGVWLLSYTGVDNRWVALLVGLLVGVILWQIPVVGGLLNFLIFLLGLGALVSGLYARRRRPRAGPGTTPEEAPAD